MNHLNFPRKFQKSPQQSIESCKLVKEKSFEPAYIGVNNNSLKFIPISNSSLNISYNSNKFISSLSNQHSSKTYDNLILDSNKNDAYSFIVHKPNNIASWKLLEDNFQKTKILTESNLKCNLEQIKHDDISIPSQKNLNYNEKIFNIHVEMVQSQFKYISTEIQSSYFHKELQPLIIGKNINKLKNAGLNSTTPDKLPPKIAHIYDSSNKNKKKRKNNKVEFEPQFENVSFHKHNNFLDESFSGANSDSFDVKKLIKNKKIAKYSSINNKFEIMYSTNSSLTKNSDFVNPVDNQDKAPLNISSKKDSYNMLNSIVCNPLNSIHLKQVVEKNENLSKLNNIQSKLSKNEIEQDETNSFDFQKKNIDPYSFIYSSNLIESFGIKSQAQVSSNLDIDEKKKKNANKPKTYRNINQKMRYGIMYQK